MKSLNQIYQPHPIGKLQQDLRRYEIVKAFSQYIDESTFNTWHLALYKFAIVRPLLYVQRQTIQDTLNFLNQHVDLTIQALTHLQDEVSHAVLSLLRPGTSWNREEKLSLQNPAGLFDFESTWHPEYQRYSEHVLNHLIRVPLFVLEQIKGKSYLNQTIAQRVDRIRENGLATSVQGFDSTVRNALAHGWSTFSEYEMTYKDKDKIKSLSASEFARTFDALVDSCHSILVALLLFMCEHRVKIETTVQQSIPLGLKFLFVDAFASYNNLSLTSMIESYTVNNDKQLNIRCKISSQSRLIHIVEGLHICWNVLSLGGSYDRFSVTFDCNGLVPQTLFVNGKRLRQAMTANETPAACGSELIEGSMLFLDASDLQRRVYKWRSIFPLVWETAKNQLVDQLKEGGLNMYSSKYTIRYIENRSNPGSIRRVLAHVVLHESSILTNNDIQGIVKHVVHKLRKREVPGRDLQGKDEPALTPSYVWVHLYVEDKRVRTLLGTVDLIVIYDSMKSSTFTKDCHAALSCCCQQQSPPAGADQSHP